jgi:hypothetical protein
MGGVDDVTGLESGFALLVYIMLMIGDPRFASGTVSRPQTE